GILAQHGSEAYYKRNEGGGAFSPVQALSRKPSVMHLGGAQHLTDLDGSGDQFLVQIGAQPEGFARREGDVWGAFRPFPRIPDINWQAANVQYVDLSGDGIPDVLVVEGDQLTWYPSIGKDGW